MVAEISDEEKKRRGTFRADESKAARLEKRAAKIITGVFLSKIPEPEFPLGEKGSVRRNEYDKLTQLLLDQGKLTEITVRLAEAAAVSRGNIHDCLAAGKNPTSKETETYKSIISKLDLAEKAQTIGVPTKNKFSGHGWSHKAGSPIRIVKAS